MKRFFLLVTILVLFLTVVSAGQVKAWFAPGATAGWPPMTTGLTGEIVSPFYTAASDSYNAGETVTINVKGINPTDSEVNANYYLVISRIFQAPIGTDITSGNPALDENQLNTFHQTGNDVQSQIAVIGLGAKVFPANGELTFSGSYTTTDSGYYQFDFMDIDPSEGYQPGHILAAGFFRVLGNTVTDICANLDGVQTSVPDGLHQAGPNCIAFELGGPPPPPSSNNGGQVLGTTTSRTTGKILGASTLGATGTVNNAISLSLIAAGTAITVISIYGIKKNLQA